MSFLFLKSSRNFPFLLGPVRHDRFYSSLLCYFSDLLAFLVILVFLTSQAVHYAAFAFNFSLPIMLLSYLSIYLTLSLPQVSVPILVREVGILCPLCLKQNSHPPFHHFIFISLFFFFLVFITTTKLLIFLLFNYHCYRHHRCYYFAYLSPLECKFPKCRFFVSFTDIFTVPRMGPTTGIGSQEILMQQFFFQSSAKTLDIQFM